MALKRVCNLIVILGPTASGKTGVAVKVARLIGSEIISADSRQVYRGLDIGSGKDLREYAEGGRSVPYHLIDMVDPGYEFNLFEFQQRFFGVFEEMRGRGLLPVLAGGTGLYIDSVVRGYEMRAVPEDRELRRELERLDHDALAARLKSLTPHIHNTTDLNERGRLIRAIEIAAFTANEETPPPSLPEVLPLVIGLKWERGELQERISKRLRERLEEGMIEEVEGLHRSGVSWETLDFFGLEYRYVALHLRGEMGRNDLFQQLNAAIRKFAKRQETWFRRMERKGVEIHWIERGEYKKIEELLRRELPGLCKNIPR